MSKMTLEEALTLARAFSHYLNLVGIAKTHHRLHKTRNVAHLSKSCDDIFSQLIQGGVSLEKLYDTVCNQEVEIVLTAHSTQINRRTLQYKHIRIAHTGRPLPLTCTPIKFGAWMGGDRDENPNVTAK
ncbi:phosphoenolpyruvate carboxylase 4-like [Rhododendron vialii]|uniref:phosphoenolpyruvate carboxylase 4-like n=1 Tax=Rhododendron vialii TaxID=182163 RepID=UPI00265DE0ED|nr:phosphoenolpyruvate carboxylase 4-like [Rhododendron vialii]